MIGARRAPLAVSWARMRRVASSPSITGIWQSIRTQSKACAAWVVTACAPSATSVTRWPPPSSTARATMRLISLSSTKSTDNERAIGVRICVVGPGPGATPKRRAATASFSVSGSPSLIRTSKLDPVPGALRTLTSPPMRCASSRTIYSPRPVPPWRRVSELSTCTKGLNSVPSFSAAIPMPLSTTRMRKPDSPVASVATALAAIDTSPCSVNLIALPARFTKIWRKRPSSPSKVTGTPASTRTTSASPLASASGSSMARTRANSARGSKLAFASSRWPASMRETSSTSLMMSSREPAAL